MVNDLIFEDESYSIRGAIFEVYKEKGNGFLEPVYQECMEKELTFQNISFKSQPEISIYYKNEILKKKYIPDFICYDKIILELKTVTKLTEEHKAQLFNYLKATDLRL